jgi:hypothetical protein
MTTPRKNAFSVFEEGLLRDLKTLSLAFTKLEEENADLRARLAVYETVEEEPPFSSPTPTPTSPMGILG